jgi:HAD superfamily hydrolase (TIGR01490 family)
MTDLDAHLQKVAQWPAGHVCLFDLDHTLLPLDSDFSWGSFTTQIGWTDAKTFAAANEGFYQQYKAGTLDIHAYVRFATAAIAQRPKAQTDAARLRYMAEVIRPAIKPTALALLQAHQQAGHVVAIVTATNEWVTRPIADALGVSNLLAIGLTLDARGQVTGDIDGVPSFREGKVTRVAQWLQARGHGQVFSAQRPLSAHFYSDSMNDMPLLECVTDPVATNPDDRLRALAAQRGWPVLDLFSPA